MYNRFSHEEMARRWALARDLMRQHELGGLIVYGDSSINRHGNANIFWLTNYLDLHHNYLVAALDESVEPALFTGLTNHVPNARQVSAIQLIEWGGYNAGERVVERLKQIGLANSRVGLVGVSSKWNKGIPHQQYLTITGTLPNLTLVDVTAEYTRFRAVKSDEEVGWMRKAAEFTDRTIYALQRQIEVGMPEYALLGIIEGSYRMDGGQPHIAFLRSMPMDAPNGCLPSQNPGDRQIQKGDVIITEISASYWGYSGQIHRPIFIGADPTPKWQHMFDTALAAYNRIADVIRPGASEGDVIKASSVIGENGYAIYDDLIHGYGVDIHPPLVDRSCVQYWLNDKEPPPGRTFQKNMIMVIQPNPITADERMGLQLGAATVVMDDGAVSLHNVPFEPIIVEV